MAASANPVANGGGEDERNNNNNVNGTTATTNGVSVLDISVIVGPTQSALRNDSGGLSVQWTPDEQSLLEELLAKYAKDCNLVRYSKIAMQLKDKYVRDIALRCRSMRKKENAKQRKEDLISRKNKDKKEKDMDSLPKSNHIANHTNGPPSAQAIMSMESDDGISFQATGGPTAQLLEENAKALDQISVNLSFFKIQDNINLFCQARNNILTVLNGLTNAPEVMNQMPPLPVKLNHELANSILQQPPLPTNSRGPGLFPPRIP